MSDLFSPCHSSQLEKVKLEKGDRLLFFKKDSFIKWKDFFKRKETFLHF